MYRVIANSIVGISTRYGSIRNDEGFDISELIKLQNQFGDKLIDKFDNVEVPEKLFEIPCDLLIPGARTGVLTEKIANSIINFSKPKAIVPVSNAPYT
ncbi:MAG: Cryptic catabolic NAD-specific glutamate dehydrogenase GudB, partial [Candidatus Heimdallarchaeota archaeon LC_2]